MLVEVISNQPDAARAWIEQIAQIESATVIELFARIPAGWRFFT